MNHAVHTSKWPQGEKYLDVAWLGDDRGVLSLAADFFDWVRK